MTKVAFDAHMHKARNRHRRASSHQREDKTIFAGRHSTSYGSRQFVGWVTQPSIDDVGINLSHLYASRAFDSSRSTRPQLPPHR